MWPEKGTQTCFSSSGCQGLENDGSCDISQDGGGEGGGGDCDSFTAKRRFGVGERGGSIVILSQESMFGGGGSNVILSARGFVGITSCSAGNCIVTSCLVVASSMFFSVHCTDMLMVRQINSITILFAYFFDILIPFNISCCN